MPSFATTNDFEARLPKPPRFEGVTDGPEIWVQEDIYGHRFGSDQEPYMILLEALGICAETPLGSSPPANEQHEVITCVKKHQRKLRFLLFQDRSLEMVERDDSIARTDKWRRWKAEVNLQFQPGSDPNADAFAYLDDNFSQNFDFLIQAVRILQSIEMDPYNNRRWTSRFLNVTGKELVLADLSQKKRGSMTVDRRFFSRSGELVYLMLGRSSKANELGRLIEQRFFNPSDPMARIAKSLAAPDDSESRAEIGYLPIKEHNAYHRLGDDWAALLRLSDLPASHLFDPLMRSTSLNLVRYWAERASEVIGNAPEPIVMDMQDGRDPHLLRVSKNSLQQHRKAANDAVVAFVERKLSMNGWEEAVASDDRLRSANILTKCFQLSPKFQADGHKTPERQKLDLIHKIKNRSDNNMHQQLLSLVKNSQFAIARQRLGTWFASSDSALRALVLSNVPHNMEILQFLERLYDRYGLVVGPVEARRIYRRLPCDIRCFETNLQVLERRLTNMGLTQRLSDDCAFVINPYRKEVDGTNDS